MVRVPPDTEEVEASLKAEPGGSGSDPRLVMEALRSLRERDAGLGRRVSPVKEAPLDSPPVRVHAQLPRGNERAS